MPRAEPRVTGVGGSAPSGTGDAAGDPADAEAIRRAPLTWGQLWPWLDHYRRRDEREFEFFQGACEVPAALDLAAVHGVLADLVRRHEGLRSTYEIGPDDEPVQIVRAADHVPVAVEPSGDPAAAAEAFFRSAHEVDPDRQPVRFGVLVADGRPRQVLLSLDHVVGDGCAGELVLAETRELLAAAARGQPPDLPPVRLQPVDHARWEAGAPGRAAGAASARYSRAQFTAMPRTLFPEAAQGVTRAAIRVDLVSTAAARAAAVLAERYQVSVPVIGRATLSAGLALVTGFGEVTVEIQGANRFTPAELGMVSSQVMPSLATERVDPGEPLASLLPRAVRTTMDSLQHSRGNHVERLQDSVRVAHQRGVTFYAIPEFNFVRSGPSAPPAGAPKPVAEPAEPAAGAGPTRRSGIEDALSATTLSTSDDLVWFDRFRVDVDSLADEMRLTVFASERIMDADRTRRLLLLYERLLTTACLNPDVPMGAVAEAVGVRPPPRDDEWVFTDHCWVHRPAVRAQLARCPGVRHGAVFPYRRGEATFLRAYLVPTAADVGPETVHGEILGRLDADPSAVAPHWYVVCADAPAEGAPAEGAPAEGAPAEGAPAEGEPEDEAGWAGRTVLAEGDGRAVLPREARTAPERELARALREHAGLADAALDCCYAVAGGAMSRVPAVLRALARRGYGGIDVADFYRFRTLAQIAGGLVPLSSPDPATGPGGPGAGSEASACGSG